MMLPKQRFQPPPPRPPASSEAGFSIIEGLIAALLLLVVTLGILPLFSRAMNNNIKGSDSTRESNGAIDAFETAVSLPFNSGDMTIAPTTTETVVVDTIALKNVASPTGGANQAISTRWELPAALAIGELRLVNRTRTLQQFSFDDFTDSEPSNNPLDGAVEPRRVHLKVLDVVLQDATGTQAQRYQLRLVKAY